MITITVQVSQDCKDTTTITVEKALCWSSGRPYTLEDYAIFAEIKKDRAQNIQPKLD